MAKKILIRDLTLRDGQQSSFATRMNQSQVDSVLPFYKEAGFYAMEVWGGAVPDSVMRYLGENPWDRLEKIKAAVGDVSKLTALSRGRNLFGYSPYTDEIIEGFCRNAIESGLGIMRIFDALNDVDNVKSTIKYVKKYGGLADCAVCYTIDPHFSAGERLVSLLKGKKLPGKVFTDAYFLKKAQEMEGGLEPGVFVSVRANIREDDRTSSKSVAAQSIDPLGGKKRKSKSGDQGPLNIIVSPLRHTRKNLEQIRDILKRYPGRSKVNLTIKDSLGHSQILELDERFRVNRCPELETELSMYN